MERVKYLRRYRKVFGNEIKINVVNQVKFMNDLKYSTKLITAENNHCYLKMCRKSGSWVNIGFKGIRAIFWTSRYLNYFKGLPNVSYTRNFGTGIIRSSDLISLRNVVISSAQNSNSLNIYSHQIRSNKHNLLSESAFYLCVNGANSFQHFIQDLLPILTLAQPFLQKNPRIPILLKKPDLRFTSFEDFFKLLDIKNQKIYIEDGDLTVDNLFFINFNPINAIYAHPRELYAKMHNSFHKVIPERTHRQKNLVLLIRNEATRNFDNLEEICNKLTAIAKSLRLTPIFINPSNESFETVIDVFGNAEVILGAHGGAMYNVVFAPSGATVVEFVTITDTDSLLHMSMSLGLNYFPYAIKSGKRDSKIFVSADDIDCIFYTLKESSPISG
jgi:hypothetical protein